MQDVYKRQGPAKTDVTTGGSVKEPRYVTFVDKDGNPGKVRNGQPIPDGAKYAVLDDYYYPNHDGIDFYHHYKEDIALFAEMGFKMFRLSISSVSYTHLDVYKRQCFPSTPFSKHSNDNTIILFKIQNCFA